MSTSVSVWNPDLIMEQKKELRSGYQPRYKSLALYFWLVCVFRVVSKWSLSRCVCPRDVISPHYWRSLKMTICGSEKKCVAMVTSQCPVDHGWAQRMHSWETDYFLILMILFTCFTCSYYTQARQQESNVDFSEYYIYSYEAASTFSVQTLYRNLEV